MCRKGAITNIQTFKPSKHACANAPGMARRRRARRRRPKSMLGAAMTDHARAWFADSQTCTPCRRSNMRTCEPAANMRTCEPANLRTCEHSNMRTCEPANLRTIRMSTSSRLRTCEAKAPGSGCVSPLRAWCTCTLARSRTSVACAFVHACVCECGRGVGRTTHGGVVFVEEPGLFDGDKADRAATDTASRRRLTGGGSRESGQARRSHGQGFVPNHSPANFCGAVPAQHKKPSGPIWWRRRWT